MKTTTLFLTLTMAFFLFSCEDKKNAPEPEKPTSLSRVRGFMVSDAKDFDRNTLNATVEWGANVIRLPILPERYARINNIGIWDALPTYLNILDERIRWAKARNLKVVIDLHGAPVENPGDIFQPEFWNKPEVKPGFIRIWKEIAAKFKDSTYNDVIWGYDLYNEPVEQVPSTAHIPFKWREMVPEIISAIREIDNDVWIIYEPGPWGDPLGYTELTPLEDKRVIYSIHYYSPGEFSHQGVNGFYGANSKEEAKKRIGKEYPADYPELYWDNVEKKDKYRRVHWDKEKHIKTLQPVIDFQKKYNVPIYVGEFSVIRWAPVESAKHWLTDMIDLFEENGWSWSYHAFREWHGWDLEYKEGPGEFWFQGDPYPERSKTETERAKIIKAALQKNKTVMS